jgi:hypothetical protein
MKDEEKRDLVKSCGLDWHRGYMPLYDNDETNRYAVLIDEAISVERQRCAAVARRLRDEWLQRHGIPSAYDAGRITALENVADAIMGVQ